MFKMNSIMNIDSKITINVLCFSPIGEIFRARIRQFPALVNNCTIDWFSNWPESALKVSSKLHLKHFQLIIIDLVKYFNQFTWLLSECCTPFSKRSWRFKCEPCAVWWHCINVSVYATKRNWWKCDISTSKH